MPGLHSATTQKIILATISFAVFMATLDSSIVNISLPTIAEYFHCGLGIISWVVIAYMLALAGLMLAFGRLGDIFGFRRIFILGFIVFTAGSLLCGLAATIGLLVAFRVLQGIGAAAIEAISPAMITHYLPAEKRGWAIGIMMTVVSLGIAAGPIIGGYITEYLGWYWIFFINVPVGIVAILVAARYLPVDAEQQAKSRFDTAGSILILLALTTLIYPLNQGLYQGWGSPLILGSLAASLVFFALFYLRERRCAFPLVDLNLFSSKNYLWGNIAGMLVILVFAGSEFLLPFYLEMVRGISVEIAGLFLAVPAVFLMACGPVAGKLSDRYGSRGLMIVSSLLAAGTLYLYSLFDAATGTAFMVAALALEGVAVGIFVPPNMNLILGAGRHEGEGVASSVMMTLRNVGGVLGIAVFGTVAVSVILATIAGPVAAMPSPVELVPGFQAAFLAGAVICLAVTAISVFVKDGTRQVPPP